jgi:hypothetical protein
MRNKEQLLKEEMDNFYSLQNTVRIIKLRRQRRA